MATEKDTGILTVAVVRDGRNGEADSGSFFLLIAHFV